MKVLHIVPSYKPAYVYGGPIESIAKLCEGLAAMGNEIHVLTTTANGEKELNIEPGTTKEVDGVKVTYFRRVTKDPTHASPALWIHLFKNVKHYDLVHIHSWWNLLVIVSALICHLQSVKLVVAPRGMLSKYIFNSSFSILKKLIHYTIGSKILSKSYYHATSEAEKEECERLIGGWKGFVVPNILDLPDEPIEKSTEPQLRLLFLSRLHPKKGLELLIESLSTIRFPFSLTIAGSGEEQYVDELKALAQYHHVEDRITWKGWISREDKYGELQKADVFVLVSHNENFANSVIEALHMGTAVLVSEGVALAGFVREHDLGWVCPRDLNSIAAAVQDAYLNKEKNMRICRTSREIVQQVFSEERVLNSYIQEYQSLLLT
ncbi:XrtY-associated glycosyltransferase XYAG1 [Pedobacter sp. SYSU D00535]|uniref:XrtY-associated glycosyltransferase XYAG1 n=1 Tax=Pedobacter sp. SYSU D00535 TaxID=2810308 RepID=UPI001A956CC2|nr:glycosyltransferase [Pedobacter sp. SYSU D00535]